jgi:hypothetical protein
LGDSPHHLTGLRGPPAFSPDLPCNTETASDRRQRSRPNTSETDLLLSDTTLPLPKNAWLDYDSRAFALQCLHCQTTTLTTEFLNCCRNTKVSTFTRHPKRLRSHGGTKKNRCLLQRGRHQRKRQAVFGRLTQLTRLHSAAQTQWRTAARSGPKRRFYMYHHAQPQCP